MRAWWVLAGVVAAGAAVSAVAGLADDPAAKPKGKIEITVAEKTDALDAAVKSNKGKVVVIDFWATWCAPCVKKFPHLVELHQKYADKGLVCVSVSLDDLEDKGKALDFLKEKGATFPNFLLSVSGKEEDKKLEERYGLRGAIPHMVVFGRSGEKVWSATGEKTTPKELDELIEAELAKK
ncbi:MAG TPA: TlpA disulfide reductase family protein [Gemmataceae bacterium]|nr:TlpA disulfide reductase family protein [Gemmataceae bacterium]